MSSISLELKSRLLAVKRNWPNMVQFLRDRNLGEQTFGKYAELTLERDRMSLDLPIATYLCSHYRLLTKNCRGIDRVKGARVALNLYEIAKYHGWAPPPPPTPPDPSHVLANLRSMGVPDDYPVAGSFMTMLARKAAQTYGFATVHQLCKNIFVDSSILGGKQRHIGKKTKAEIRALLAAAQAADRGAMRKFLPLRQTTEGIDLCLAVKRFLPDKSKLGVEEVYQRIVLRKTLQQVGASKGVSRERARQVPEKLMERLKALLDAQPSIRQNLWAQWSESGTLLMESDEDILTQELAAEAVLSVFESAPGSNQVKEQLNARFDVCISALRKDPDYYFGTLDILAFLQRAGRIPLRSLLRWNESRQEFRYNEETGCVTSLSVQPKQLVAALLLAGTCQATTIIKQMRMVRGLESYSLRALFRNYYRWIHDKDFPQIKIGWKRDPDNLENGHQCSSAADVGRGDGRPRRLVIATVNTRDSDLHRDVKTANDFRCQICFRRIELPAGQGFYAEAHHIRPLGEPHNGTDAVSNLMCVCPHHHTQLDWGVIKISRAELRGTRDVISDECIEYHNREIFGKPARRCRHIEFLAQILQNPAALPA